MPCQMSSVVDLFEHLHDRHPQLHGPSTSSMACHRVLITGDPNCSSALARPAKICHVADYEVRFLRAASVIYVT